MTTLAAKTPGANGGLVGLSDHSTLVYNRWDDCASPITATEGETVSLQEPDFLGALECSSCPVVLLCRLQARAEFFADLRESSRELGAMAVETSRLLDVVEPTARGWVEQAVNAMLASKHLLLLAYFRDRGVTE
ncbi:MAG: hypothetical protein ABSH53_21640 [Holophaga sp.]|jgi:hypothetical protein